MLIELPPLQEYSMADCQDLFMSQMDEDGYFSGSQFSKTIVTGPRAAQESNNVLSDAEPFLYTSSSDSDMDVCFSDIEPPTGVLAVRKMETRLSSDASVPCMQGQNEIALHSPGQLLGTPRDSSRRYEYPFPAHLLGVEQSIAGDVPASTATTPGLIPAEGSSLGLLPLAAPDATTSRSASLPIHSQRAPVPVPVSSPITITRANVIPAANTESGSLAPLLQVPLVPGPASAPAAAAPTMIAAHPKLSGFNPANVPVPPSLRRRTRRSASISVPQALQPIPSAVASVAMPTTTVRGS